MADCVIAGDGRRIALTVSVGANTARPELGDFDELLKEGDVALYEAKRASRNRVCQFAAASPGSRPTGQSEPR